MRGFLVAIAACSWLFMLVGGGTLFEYMVAAVLGILCMLGAVDYGIHRAVEQRQILIEQNQQIIELLAMRKQRSAERPVVPSAEKKNDG